MKQAARLIALMVATLCGVFFLAACVAIYENWQLEQSANQKIDALHAVHLDLPHVSYNGKEAFIETGLLGLAFAGSIFAFRRLAPDMHNRAR